MTTHRASLYTIILYTSLNYSCGYGRSEALTGEGFEFRVEFVDIEVPLEDSTVAPDATSFRGMGG